jgi:hypothetical protein
VLLKLTIPKKLAVILWFLWSKIKKDAFRAKKSREKNVKNPKDVYFLKRYEEV